MKINNNTILIYSFEILATLNKLFGSCCFISCTCQQEDCACKGYCPYSTINTKNVIKILMRKLNFIEISQCYEFRKANINYCLIYFPYLSQICRNKVKEIKAFLHVRNVSKDHLTSTALSKNNTRFFKCTNVSFHLPRLNFLFLQNLRSWNQLSSGFGDHLHL